MACLNWAGHVQGFKKKNSVKDQQTILLQQSNARTVYDILSYHLSTKKPVTRGQ